YKVALFANVDLEAELARRRRDKSKLTYLKSLLAKELITEETFQCHARRFTGADVDDAGPDEDVVRL
ncbi:MAG: hypothetical protein HKP58_19400, partial [Desulfatitalea sp.]|nr:hypothetical protein [Desulfatitalea sp.]NNK02583.1 hypothetical protein [Desulfatitalea sp.]